MLVTFTFFFNEDEVLEELKEILLEVEYPLIIYFKSLREVDRVCVTSNFKDADWEQKLFDFEQFFKIICVNVLT